MFKDGLFSNATQSDEKKKRVTEMESAGTEYPANATTAAAAAAVDLIGGIPYDVLTTILSLLPVRDAACTALLSSQWRHLWKSAPLCLDDCAVNSSSNDDNEWRARAISSILASHHGPIRRFSLSHTLLCGRKSLVHSWFQTLSQKQVQHVQFNYLLFPRPGPEIPASLFACESLLTLTLRNSRFPDTTEAHLNLVRLTELNLIATSLTDADMQSIISSCTALRSLMILGNSSIRQIRLRSRSLLSLTLSFCRNLEELIIEDAPNLDRLIGSELMSTARVKVVGAPKLSILGLIDIHMPIERLELGSSVFMGADATLGSLMHSLKILAVAMKFGSYEKVKMLIDLLRCFPCLERLHIECSSWSFLDEPDFEYSKYSKLSSPIACLDRHLRTVKLKDYLGEECELEFVKFLFAKARMLKVAEFEFADSCNDIIISQQKHLICLLNRASADTQISFFPRKPHSGNFNKHTSTLSLSDPFDS